MSQYTVGVDVGGTNTRMGLFDDRMQTLRTFSYATDQEMDAEQILGGIAKRVGRLIAEANIASADVKAVGVAFPSFIDADRGMILETSNITALYNVPAKKKLEEKLDLPVFIDNNTNAAALAEHRLGAGRGQRNMIYVSVSTGIGGGLILNGELFRGMHGMAGEIGHMFISDSSSYTCGCGVTGCVQSIASGMYMAEYAMDRIKEGAESRILDYAGTLRRIDMIAVGKAYREGDALAIEVVERGAEYVARMCQSLNQIFDVNVFVFGGGVMQLGSPFFSQIVHRYRRYAMFDKLYPAKFLLSELGGNSEMIGAALLGHN